MSLNETEHDNMPDGVTFCALQHSSAHSIYAGLYANIVDGMFTMCLVVENMLPLRWHYTIKCAFMHIAAKASTYIHESHSIVTPASLAV